MKYNIIFRLDKCKYFYYDKEDDEDVEDRYVLGYFNSPEKLADAIQTCKQYGVAEEELQVQKFALKYTERQKFLYILSYEYAIMNSKNEYIDYSYVFPPQINRQFCNQLKIKLMQEDRYKKTDNKIFDSMPPDGFWIEKVQINKLYSVIPRASG